MYKKLEYLVIIALLTSCTNKIYQINKMVNSYRYIPDKVNYMKTPEQFMKDGGGDCEDFANVKYHQLISSGYKPKFVLITEGIPHAVVEVEGVILDNRNDNLNPAAMVEGYRVNYAQMQTISGNRN